MKVKIIHALLTLSLMHSMTFCAIADGSHSELPIFSKVPSSLGTQENAQTEDQYIQGVADEFGKSLVALGIKKVGVVDFADVEGQPPDFGRFITHKFSVDLESTGNVSVVDRTLIYRIIGEHKLTTKNLVKPANCKKLGDLAGVDAIVIGTVLRLGTGFPVVVHAISTRSSRDVETTIFGVPGSYAEHGGINSSSADERGADSGDVDLIDVSIPAGVSKTAETPSPTDVSQPDRPDGGTFASGSGEHPNEAFQPAIDLVAAKAKADAGDQASLDILEQAVAHGDEVVFNVKLSSVDMAVGAYLYDGTVIVSSRGVSFRHTAGDRYKPDFMVSPAKILGLALESPQPAQDINLRVAIMNRKGKEDKYTYQLYNSGAALVVVSSSGYTNIVQLRCEGCDSSIEVLFALLKTVTETN